jgi:4-hydroxyacetophenone monooxygenase
VQMLGPMELTGRSGRTLRETWGEDDARAYLGISVPDMPNFFILFGPNTSTGHGGSAFLTTEFQVRYVMALLAEMFEHELLSVECRRDVHDAYNEELDARLEQAVWTHPGVTNYYRNASGRIVGTSPWKYIEYWERALRPNLDDYVTDRVPR